MKLKQFLSGILASAVVLGTMSIPVFAQDAWNGTTVDTSWYNETDTSFTISTGAQLAGLAKLVNEGNNFSKKTIILGDDINLDDKSWTPIGKSGKSFDGTFDGNKKIISNLYINTPSVSDVGLFGFTQSGEVKNFTLTNANIAGYLDVGPVAGTPYTSKYSDITVNGNVNVQGMSYVGGAFGKNVYANITNVDIDAAAGSLVSAKSVENGIAYRTYVGGLIGFIGEGGHTIKDCDIKIDVCGDVCDVGGITGILHYGNKLIDCTYEGSLELKGESPDEPDNEEFGVFCGTFNTSNKTVPTISGCSANLIKATLKGEDITENISPYGAFYNRSTVDNGYTLVVENTEVNGDTVSPSIGGFEVVKDGETLQYFNLKNAITAAQSATEETPVELALKESEGPTSDITELITSVSGITGASKAYISVKIPVSNGSVTFDSAAVEAISVAAKDAAITLSIEDITEENIKTYSVTLKANGEAIDTGNTVTATVELPVPNGIISPVVYYVPHEGAKEDMNAVIDESNLRFTTSYLASIYTIEEEMVSEFKTEADAGYYSEAADSEDKNGVIAFRSFFEGYNNDAYTLENYGIFVYNTEMNQVDLQTTDIEALKANNGNFIGKITDIPAVSFDTRIYAKPYVKINGVMKYGETVSTTVNEINKWLGPAVIEEAE